MKLLRQGLANDISFQDDPCKDVACEVCLKGKQARFPFPSHPEKSVAAKRLDLIHTDLCGPLPVNSLGGKRYILTFLDDHSRKVFVYFLKRKSEVSEYTKNFISLVETQTGDKVKVLRSDNGTEYVNRDLEGFLKGKGIVHQVTVPYSPQQNSCAERLNRTLLEKVRCLLYTSNLDHKFWAEAAGTAAHLINVSPSKRLSGKTPEEAWTGKKVSLKHLRVFGCEAYAHIDKVKRNKLEPKSKRCIFLGYETNGYRLYDLAKNLVFRSRDVVFNETIFPGVKSTRSVEIFFPTSDDGGIAEESHAEDEPAVELEAENAEMPLPPNMEIQIEAERPVAPEVWFEADEQVSSSSTDTGGIPREPLNDGPAYSIQFNIHLFRCLRSIG
jgi:transposase InsO family protein